MPPCTRPMWPSRPGATSARLKRRTLCAFPPPTRWPSCKMPSNACQPGCSHARAPAHQNLRFSAARLDDALWVTARVQEAGRVSLTIAQQVLLRRQHATSGQQDALLAEGTIRIGWVDAATLKPGRIPAAILEKLKS